MVVNTSNPSTGELDMGSNDLQVQWETVYQNEVENGR